MTFNFYRQCNQKFKNVKKDLVIGKKSLPTKRIFKDRTHCLMFDLILSKNI